MSCPKSRDDEYPYIIVTLCPEPAVTFLQASDAVPDASAPPAPTRSPFKKPSVQVISMSDDGSEAPAKVRCPMQQQVPPDGCVYKFATLALALACRTMAMRVLCQRHGRLLMWMHMHMQEDTISPRQLPGTWHSDELPDAEALVSLTFRLLFPDTFQHILPVHKHKVQPSFKSICLFFCCFLRYLVSSHGLYRDDGSTRAADCSDRLEELICSAHEGRFAEQIWGVRRRWTCCCRSGTQHGPPWRAQRPSTSSAGARSGPGTSSGAASATVGSRQLLAAYFIYIAYFYCMLNLRDLKNIILSTPPRTGVHFPLFFKSTGAGANREQVRKDSPYANVISDANVILAANIILGAGEEVDSIDYWVGEVRRLECEIVDARKRALASPPCASYFVFFSSQKDAAIAAQTNIHPEDGRSFRVIEAPGPEEVPRLNFLGPPASFLASYTTS